MAMTPLDGYDFYTHPYVAVVGIVSKVIIYDVAHMTQVRSIRVLVSNWNSFSGLTALPQGRLVIGSLDGSAKVYKIKNEDD